MSINVSSFTVEEGQRKNSTVYVSSNGFRYSKNRETDNTIFLRCCLHKSCSCKAGAVIDLNTNLLRTSSLHNDDLAKYGADLIQLKVKQEAEKDSKNLRRVFDETTRSDSALRCSIQGHAIPVFHALMLSKTKEHYEMIFSKIALMCPRLYPQLAVSDYECASRGAIQQVYPNFTLNGCLFHFKQAIIRKLQKLKLITYYYSNNLFKTWIQSVKAIPFLSERCMAVAFESIIQNVPQLPGRQNSILKFQEYFKRTWLTRIKDLSIFATPIATNNAAEGYQVKLKTKISNHHPNIWIFLEALKNIAYDYEAEYSRIKSGVVEAVAASQSIQVRDKYKSKFLDGSLTSVGYIRSIAGELCQSESSVITEENIQDQLNLCTICLGERKKHLKIKI